MDSQPKVAQIPKSYSFVKSFGSEGSDDGQFTGPSHITVDEQTGNIYVPDQDNHRVQVFDENGVFLFKFGSKGKADGQFNKPTGVAISRDDPKLIVVADCSNDRMQVFNEQGHFQFKVGKQGGFMSSGSDRGEFDRPSDVAINHKTHHFVVADYENHRVQMFDKQGNFITKFWIRRIG